MSSEFLIECLDQNLIELCQVLKFWFIYQFNNSLYNIFIQRIKFAQKFGNQMGTMCSCNPDASQQSRSRKKASLGSIYERETNQSVSSPFLKLQSKQGFIYDTPKFDSISELEIIQQIGKGGQADIFEVRPLNVEKNCAITPQTYAMKRIHKNCSINKRQSIELGKSIMMDHKCPFIINGIFFSEDEDFIYHVMQKVEGGDLASFIKPRTPKSQLFKSLGQEGIKNIVAGVIVGLEHLHKNNIIYCDLKLENILIGLDGYPILCDFQMAAKGKNVSAKGFRGTLTYAAPEIIVEDQIDRAVDIWALGVLLHILAYGEAPFAPEEICTKEFIGECKKRQNKYKSQSKWASRKLSRLINDLLKANPKQRLGYCSLGQIKGHSFFNGFDWYRYERKLLENPIKTVIQKSFEKQNINELSICSSPLAKLKSKRKRSADRETQCDQFVAMLNELQIEV